jgi:NTP pyrophosphatase (non-canonical NTP hydrolase)
MDLDEIRRKMDRFVRDNGWYQTNSDKPQSAKNLSISLVLEASELLECFQWSDQAEEKIVADELADVILYAVQIANIMNIDLDQAVDLKLAMNQGRKWMTAGTEG